MEMKAFANRFLSKLHASFVIFYTDIHKYVPVAFHYIYIFLSSRDENNNPVLKNRIYSLPQRTGCWNDLIL